MPNNASTTMYTYLGFAALTESGMPTAFAKLCPIKDFPDLGGAPDTVEITDLDDDVQKFILGVQSMSSLEFTANYNPEDFATISNMADGTMYAFCVAFGKNKENPTEYGVFTWKGQIAVWVVGGGVNSAREMRISISASSKIEYSDSATITGV